MKREFKIIYNSTDKLNTLSGRPYNTIIRFIFGKDEYELMYFDNSCSDIHRRWYVTLSKKGNSEYIFLYDYNFARTFCEDVDLKHGYKKLYEEISNIPEIRQYFPQGNIDDIIKRVSDRDREVYGTIIKRRPNKIDRIISWFKRIKF